MEAEEIKSHIDEIISLKERLIERYEKLGMFEVFPRDLNVYDHAQTFDEIMKALCVSNYELEDFRAEKEFIIKSFNYGNYTIKTITHKKSSDNTDQSTVTTNA